VRNDDDDEEEEEMEDSQPFLNSPFLTKHDL
jgi:hypothetical protein